MSSRLISFDVIGLGSAFSGLGLIFRWDSLKLDFFRVNRDRTIGCPGSKNFEDISRVDDLNFRLPAGGEEDLIEKFVGVWILDWLINILYLIGDWPNRNMLNYDAEVMMNSLFTWLLEQ